MDCELGSLSGDEGVVLLSQEDVQREYALVNARLTLLEDATEPVTLQTG